MTKNKESKAKALTRNGHANHHTPARPQHSLTPSPTIQIKTEPHRQVSRTSHGGPLRVCRKQRVRVVFPSGVLNSGVVVRRNGVELASCFLVKGGVPGHTRAQAPGLCHGQASRLTHAGDNPFVFSTECVAVVCDAQHGEAPERSKGSSGHEGGSGSEEGGEKGGEGETGQGIRGKKKTKHDDQRTKERQKKETQIMKEHMSTRTYEHQNKRKNISEHTVSRRETKEERRRKKEETEKKEESTEKNINEKQECGKNSNEENMKRKGPIKKGGKDKQQQKENTR